MQSTDSFTLLGVRVDCVQIPDVVQKLFDWVEARDGCRFVAVTGMHGIMEARRDPGFRAILNSADLVVPDGMPLVWAARHRDKPLARRVYGPELMLAFCAESAKKGVRHFLYGAAPGVADQLAETLRSRFPGINIVGTYCPPFRPLTAEEESDLLTRVHACRADVVWVGISTPRQEQFMHRFRPLLNVPVLLGVGAAFDLLSGRVPQAPSWMREHGLEWFYRLLQEPRRLWRRYLVHGSRFAVYVLLEILHLKRFD